MSTAQKAIAFPDDKCWFPRCFLQTGLELLGTVKAQIVSGRSNHEAGRAIDGRLASCAQFVFHKSVSTAQIECAIRGRPNSRMRSGTADRSAETEIRAATSANSPDDRDFGPQDTFGKRRREMTGPYRARNPLLVGALYAADAFAGLLPKRRRDVSEDRPLRVLVANWGHLGDVVTILPLLKFLERHPRVQELGVLIGSWSHSVLEASDITARIHVIDHWALDRSDKATFPKITQYLMRSASLVHELSRCQYDMSIDTFASLPSSHGIMWRASIPRRVGFNSGELGRCLTDPFNWVPDDRLMLVHQLELLKPLLGEEYPKILPASYPGFKFAVSERLLGLSRAPYVVIHMGPKNIRGWVPEKWVTLAAALKGRGYELVATGGAGEEMEAAHALNEKVPVRDVTGRLSWEQFVATVAGAAAIVTIDSVTGHIAACFGVPAVVLAAGRQRIGLWRPNGSNATMLMHAVGCAPCNRSNGCSAMACVRLISVKDVLSSLQQVMNVNATARSNLLPHKDQN